MDVRLTNNWQSSHGGEEAESSTQRGQHALRIASSQAIRLSSTALTDCVASAGHGWGVQASALLTGAAAAYISSCTAGRRTVRAFAGSDSKRQASRSGGQEADVVVCW